MFLLVVDSHSKWPEVIEMKSTTTAATITELHRLFSCYGLPEQLVSDNGPQFASSDEFQSFLKSNGVKHILCALYHLIILPLMEQLNVLFRFSRKPCKVVAKVIHLSLNV